MEFEEKYPLLWTVTGTGRKLEYGSENLNDAPNRFVYVYFFESVRFYVPNYQ